MTDRALVLCSSGQGSTSCLAWSLQRYAHVETIGFDHGRCYAFEMKCRDAVRAVLRLPGRTLAAIVEHAHGCCLGDRAARHEWGHGCGACPACALRASGWTRFHDARTALDS